MDFIVIVCGGESGTRECESFSVCQMFREFRSCCSGGSSRVRLLRFRLRVCGETWGGNGGGFLLSQVVCAFTREAVGRRVAVGGFTSVFVILFTYLSLRTRRRTVAFNRLPGGTGVFILACFGGVPFGRICVRHQTDLARCRMGLGNNVSLRFSHAKLYARIDYTGKTMPSRVVPRGVLLAAGGRFPGGCVHGFRGGKHVCSLRLSGNAILAFDEALHLMSVSR